MLFFLKSFVLGLVGYDFFLLLMLGSNHLFYLFHFANARADVVTFQNVQERTVDSVCDFRVQQKMSFRLIRAILIFHVLAVLVLCGSALLRRNVTCLFRFWCQEVSHSSLVLFPGVAQ